MSFTAFTAVTGYPLQAIDLYLQSDTGAVLNTRSNLEVRHNETNRFFAIPYNAALTLSDLYLSSNGANFMNDGPNDGAFASYGRYYMVGATLAARPLENSGDYAFYVSATTTREGTIQTTIQNSINYNNFSNSKNVGTFGSNIVEFVVTSMSAQVLDLSRASLAAGGDGSVPLVAQVMYSAIGGPASFYPTRFAGMVTTAFSQPFALTCVAPLHRTLAY